MAPKKASNEKYCNTKMTFWQDLGWGASRHPETFQPKRACLYRCTRPRGKHGQGRGLRETHSRYDLSKIRYFDTWNTFDMFDITSSSRSAGFSLMCVHTQGRWEGETRNRSLLLFMRSPVFVFLETPSEFFFSVLCFSPSVAIYLLLYCEL